MGIQTWFEDECASGYVDLRLVLDLWEGRGAGSDDA
jgi:hypothetical protein